MMLELSPLLTATKAAADWMPASMRTSRSNPMPVTRRPWKPGRSRRKACGSRSMMATECPLSSRMWARVAPTRPHPMITTCIVPRRSIGVVFYRPVCPGLPDSVSGGRSSRAHGTRALGLSGVWKITHLVKRLLVGRALRSTQPHHQRRPNRVAWQIFASDALSSVAYAPQEILIVLSIGGVGFYAYGPWVAAAVVLVIATAVASYRQKVYAYPRGGGDYEEVTTTLRTNPGLRVASALIADYVRAGAVTGTNRRAS